MKDWTASVRRLGARIHAYVRRVDDKLWAWYQRLRVGRFATRLGHHHFGLKLLLLAIVATYIFDYSLYATCGLRGCPDPARLVAYQPGGATVLYDRHGRKFADLAPVEREMVKIADLPDYVPQAFIAVEDKRFYHHHGVDWKRVVGAALRNLASGEIDQGSSTITMQLSRNIFSDRLNAADKSLRRKLFEARVAKQIEKRFTKKEILELYLNNIYFGGGAYGVQSASRYYFGKPAAKLKLYEAAMLAALPKAPSHYDPRSKPGRARERRDAVLQLMADQKFISADDAHDAARHRLGVTDDPPAFRGTPPLGAYFAQLVRHQLEDQLGEDVYTRKLRVYTTLDINAQRAAEEELSRELNNVESGQFGSVNGPRYRTYNHLTAAGPQYLQGAVVSLDVHTGDILALVGGRDVRHSRFNRATLARRQAGSAFKPFVYAAAIEKGYVASQPILDEPVQLVSNGRSWQPRNYDNTYYGMISMRAALTYSRNIPSVRLAAAVGHDDIAKMARAAGISAEVQNTPMVALGITEVTPLELTSAYSTFAAGGSHAEPRIVLAVRDENGDIIYRNPPKSEQRIDPGVAYVVTDMMRDVVDYGTGNAVRAAGFGAPVAGKTGTTSDGADVWFVGYTPDIATGVWIGYDERKPLPSHATGGSVSAVVFGRIMRRIYRVHQASGDFDTPGNVVTRMVDPESGMVLEDGCVPNNSEASREVFLTSNEPETTCPRHENETFFDAVGTFLSRVFGGDDEGPPDPAPGVTADGSRDILGAGKVPARKPQ